MEKTNLYNHYGNVAVKSLQLIKNNNSLSPIEAWEMAILELKVPVKGCPKSAFFGLCEEGLVKNIPSGNYTKSVDNKSYAVKAYYLLKENPSLSLNKMKLWKTIVANKKHNGQMDVVVALFYEGLLC